MDEVILKGTSKGGFAKSPSEEELKTLIKNCLGLTPVAGTTKEGMTTNIMKTISSLKKQGVEKNE